LIRTFSGTGSPASTAATSSPRPGIVATIRVSAVGTSALTVTPIRSHATAQVRIMATIAPFDAE
jgi:hypothetical protein